MSRTRSGSSTEGSEARDRLLPGPGDLPALAAIGVLAYFLVPFTWPGGPLQAAACLAGAIGVAGAGFVADRVWDATVAPALGLSPGAGATLARYPFRLLGGGIAVTVVMLAAKRADLFWLSDIPVKNIFSAGALLAAAYHAVRDTRLARWTVTSAGREGRKETTKPKD